MNVSIFVSGSGTNCENIIRYFSGSDSVSVALANYNSESIAVGSDQVAEVSNYMAKIQGGK